MALRPAPKAVAGVSEGRDDVPHEHEHQRGSANHDHEHGHDHQHGEGWLDKLAHVLPFVHHHEETEVDAALETSERGIWALKVSLLLLGITALFQLAVVLISGSVALLADMVHNFADTFTAVPLWIAFSLSRRPANRRYTFGYGRAEDVAGVIVVGIILVSALVAAYESYQKFVSPTPLRNVGWVIVAALIGFVGNEAVAVFRVRVGREIGSAALVADGQHARADGLTSLAVLFGALGVLAGFPLADPIVGLLITLAILVVVKDAAVTMWERLMDAVDEDLVDKVDRVAASIPGVEAVHDVRVRWLGHRLQADLHISVEGDLPTRDSHRIAEDVRYALLDAEPRLTSITIHADPIERAGESYHGRRAA